MKRSVTGCLVVMAVFASAPVFAQPRAAAYATAPDIPFESVPNFLKMPEGLYLGEGIGVAVNSERHVFVYTRRDDTRLLEFDQDVNFVKEWGVGLYGFSLMEDAGATRGNVHGATQIISYIDFVVSLFARLNQTTGGVALRIPRENGNFHETGVSGALQ